MPMSKQSRLRLLKEIAGIDWTVFRKYLFVTLTYPDSHFERSVQRQTIDRSMFLRHVEDYVQCPVGVLWRKEWKQRRSGKRKGQVAPHWHLLLFGVTFIDQQLVRRWWRDVLHVEGPLATDVRAIDDGQAAARYTAKYVAKPQDVFTLDNAPYLSRMYGRPWGFCRQELVPRHPEMHLPDLQPDEVAELRLLAREMYEKIDPASGQGFTLFHADVRTLFELLRQRRLDARRVGR